MYKHFMKKKIIKKSIILLSCTLPSFMCFSCVSTNNNNTNVLTKNDIQEIENNNQQISKNINLISTLSPQEIQTKLDENIKEILNAYNDFKGFAKYIFQALPDSLTIKEIDDYNKNIKDKRNQADLNSIPYFAIDFQTFYLSKSSLNYENLIQNKKLVESLWSSENLNSKAVVFFVYGLFQTFQELYFTLSITPYYANELGFNLAYYVYENKNLKYYEKEDIASIYNYFYTYAMMGYYNNFLYKQTESTYQFSWMQEIFNNFSQCYSLSCFYLFYIQ